MDQIASPPAKVSARPRDGELIVFDRLPPSAGAQTDTIYLVRKKPGRDFYLTVAASISTGYARTVREEPRIIDRALWRPATAAEREAAFP